MLLREVIDLLADVDHLNVAETWQQHRDTGWVIGIDIMRIEGFLDFLDEATHPKASAFAALALDETIDVVETDEQEVATAMDQIGIVELPDQRRERIREPVLIVRIAARARADTFDEQRTFMRLGIIQRQRRLNLDVAHLAAEFGLHIAFHLRVFTDGAMWARTVEVIQGFMAFDSRLRIGEESLEIR